MARRNAQMQETILLNIWAWSTLEKSLLLGLTILSQKEYGWSKRPLTQCSFALLLIRTNRCPVDPGISYLNNCRERRGSKLRVASSSDSMNQICSWHLIKSVSLDGMLPFPSLLGEIVSMLLLSFPCQAMCDLFAFGVDFLNCCLHHLHCSVDIYQSNSALVEKITKEIPIPLYPKGMAHDDGACVSNTYPVSPNRSTNCATIGHSII